MTSLRPRPASQLGRQNPRRRAGSTGRPAGRAGGALAAAAAMVLLAALPAGAGNYVPINGAGSTWSANAIAAWASNVTQDGIQVNYAPTGSSDGRNQFRAGTVDFGVSEIPYGLMDNGQRDYPPSRHYAYMPIVAGGTSLMYNLKIGGRRVTNLRLSGDTITKIFTGVITNWSDPAIHADNPGLTLPARQIVPVVRSDGSGTTAQFTLWMSKRYQSLWNAYCGKVGVQSNPCGFTSEYPVAGNSAFITQNGSLGVAGYVAQAQNEGTITYVEYSYALNSNFPVVKLLNSAGYYVEPTAPAVAVALLQAQINSNPAAPDYLTQILDNVYTNPDPRTYPMSSYSYMIIPTTLEKGLTTIKGNTLGAFAHYFLCQGQQDAPTLGYSPLPINLVRAGFAQVKKIPGADAASVDIRACNNPTFSPDGQNLLAKTAAYPQSCDKQGPVQCATGTGGAKNTPTPTSGGNTSNGNGSNSNGSGNGPGSPGSAGPGGNGSGTGNGSGNGNGNGSGNGTPAAGRRAATGHGRKVNPVTGLPVGGSQTSGTGTGSGTDTSAASVNAEPVAVQAGISAVLEHVLMALVGLLFVGLTIGPPLVTRALGAGRKP